MSTTKRPAAVAGTFYPADAVELRRVVEKLLDEVPPSAPHHRPKAIIAPHAGYVYSGPIAATAYARLRDARGAVDRVVLLGPAHRVAVRGLAATSASVWGTPLGDVAIDRTGVDRALELPQVTTNDAAHRLEHSLEVHVPFLQVTLGEFSLAPFAVGDASRDEVAEVLEVLWGGPETLIVISSDLSHFYDYATAKELDHATSLAIESLAPEAIGEEQACGRVPVRGLLEVARRRKMRVETLDVRSSGDTAGPRREVVGYGAWAFA